MNCSQGMSPVLCSLLRNRRDDRCRLLFHRLLLRLLSRHAQELATQVGTVMRIEMI